MDLSVDNGLIAECDALSDDVAVDEETHRGAEYAKGFVLKVMETNSETFAAKVTDGGLNASFAANVIGSETLTSGLDRKATSGSSLDEIISN